MEDWAAFSADASDLAGAPDLHQGTSAGHVAELRSKLRSKLSTKKGLDKFPACLRGHAAYGDGWSELVDGWTEESLTACGRKSSVLRAAACALLSTGTLISTSSYASLLLWLAYPGGVGQLLASLGPDPEEPLPEGRARLLSVIGCCGFGLKRARPLLYFKQSCSFFFPHLWRDRYHSVSPSYSGSRVL